MESKESEAKSSFRALKLVVFGASGNTGIALVKQGLDLGHEITAILRSPEKFLIKHENLKTVKGDAYKLESFVDEIAEKDAVMSCLGSNARGIGQTTTIYSETVKIIFEAMKRHSVKRLVAVTSWCGKKTPQNPWFFEWIIRPLYIGGALSDIAIMEDYVENTDEGDMNYTIVRPPRLTNAVGTRNFRVEEGLFNTGAGITANIPREDVAHFMLAVLQTDEYDRKMIAIQGV